MFYGAEAFAEFAIFLVPVLISAGWIWGDERIRRTVLIAAIAAFGGLVVNQVIGLVWVHPRPFMIGLGHTFIRHAPDGSFPSDHLTVWWSVALSLAFSTDRLRRFGTVMSVAGLPIAWARIYLGVHFPFDMVGALGVSALCAWAAHRYAPVYLDVSYRTVLGIRRVLLGRFISLGWLPD